MTRSVRFGILTVLAVCGMAFLLYGIFSGQVAGVIAKATHICLECIGIG